MFFNKSFVHSAKDLQNVDIVIKGYGESYGEHIKKLLTLGGLGGSVG